MSLLMTYSRSFFAIDQHRRFLTASSRAFPLPISDWTAAVGGLRGASITSLFAGQCLRVPVDVCRLFNS